MHAICETVNEGKAQLRRKGGIVERGQKVKAKKKMVADNVFAQGGFFC